MNSPFSICNVMELKYLVGVISFAQRCSVIREPLPLLAILFVPGLLALILWVIVSAP